MSIRTLPVTDGKIIVPFEEGVLTRSSIALSPDDGQSYRENKPRMASGRIPHFNFKPRIFYSFDVNTTPLMYYNSTGGSPYWIGTGGVQETFEANFVGSGKPYEKEIAGTSYENRDIVVYRMGPKSGKHLVFVSVVHGNEVDGQQGLIKALEILGTSPAFANFRSEWTLTAFVAMNPDGWLAGTRNLREVGPNSRTINLNRNFGWFWDEYIETSAESKGSAAGSTSEAQAILDYYDDVVLAGGRFGALIDFHANRGTGSRFQSRDRIWREVLYGAGQGGEVPDSFLTVPLDFYILKIFDTLSTMRTLEAPTAPGSDLFVRYFRSRFNPHLHSYFASLGIYSMAVEEVKVDDANGFETVGSACNFRLDYALTAAAAVTTDNWTFEDAVLIEKETDNLLTNANWAQWQEGSEERPSYYSLARGDTERITAKTGEKFFEDGGEAVRFVTNTDITLTIPSEYDAAACDDLNSVAVVTNSGGPPGNVFVIPAEEYNAGEIFVGGLAVHPFPVGTAAIHSGTKQIDILGGTLAPGIPPPAPVITRVNTQLATEAAVPFMGPWIARAHAGFCDNFQSFDVPAKQGYIVGGYDQFGAILNDLGTWDTTLITYIPSTQILFTPVAGACCIYEPVHRQVYIFGGMSGAGPVTTAYMWHLATDTLLPIAPLPVGLAFATGVYTPGNNKMYIYGGERAGGVMSEVIYEFDPSTFTYTSKELIQNLSDDENVEEPGDEGVPWDRKLGRATAVTMMEEPTSVGTPLVIGGRLDTSAGALVDTVYAHDILEDIIGISRTAGFGYIRRSTKLDYGYANQESTDFSSVPDFLTISYWSISGGVATSINDDCLLKSLVAPNYNNQLITCTVRKTGGTITTFSLTARATYDGDTLDNGYRLRYDESTLKWIVERVVSGVPTTIDEYAAGAGEQITTSARTVVFKVSERSPVHIVAEMNGVGIVDIYDFDVARITDTGTIGVEGRSNTGDVEIDDLAFQTSAQNEEVFAASVSAKSGPTNVSGYIRQTLYPKDDQGPNAAFVTRRVRNYYTMPPKSYYHWYRERLDLREGQTKYWEDGLRQYVRVYKDSQEMLLDGVHVHKGSLIGSSYQPYGYPRAAEKMEFADAVDINNFRIQFRWLPTAGFADIDEDIELCRVQLDANNYIALVAKAGDRVREYNTENVHGPHDPVFELRKMVGVAEPCWNQEGSFNMGGFNESGPCGSLLDQSIEVICYWGYDMRDPSVERLDDVVEFTVTHFANQTLELRVTRYGNTGVKATTASSPYTTTGFASILYNGFGYYGKLEIQKREKFNNRMLPVGRKQVRDRFRSQARGQLFAGDRDPINGQIVFNRTYDDPETFNRPDAPNLGDDWTTIEESYGFEIYSNKARCSGYGYERWVRKAQHADIIVTANVSVSNDSDRVGVLARWDTSLSDVGISANMTAYSAELQQTGTTSAAVRIIRWHLGVEEVLNTAALSSYTAGEELELIFTLEGSSLEATITGRGTVSATDDNYSRPYRLGIYGSTGGPTQYVTVDNFNVEPNFKRSITD